MKSSQRNAQFCLYGGRVFNLILAKKLLNRGFTDFYFVDSPFRYKEPEVHFFSAHEAMPSDIIEFNEYIEFYWKSYDIKMAAKEMRFESATYGFNIKKLRSHVVQELSNLKRYFVGDEGLEVHGQLEFDDRPSPFHISKPICHLLSSSTTLNFSYHHGIERPQLKSMKGIEGSFYIYPLDKNRLFIADHCFKNQAHKRYTKREAIPKLNLYFKEAFSVERFCSQITPVYLFPKSNDLVDLQSHVLAVGYRGGMVHPITRSEWAPAFQWSNLLSDNLNLSIDKLKEVLKLYSSHWRAKSLNYKPLLEARVRSRFQCHEQLEKLFAKSKSYIFKYFQSECNPREILASAQRPAEIILPNQNHADSFSSITS